MGFAASLRKHLATYKRQHLGVAQDGLWKKQKLAYPHILPESERDKNILTAIRCDFWDWFRRPKLHRDFHHLNSSQAMGFNLFFPFLNYGPKRAAALLEALDVPVEPILDWEFEKVPDPDEGTNFDLWLKLESGRQLFFELKLTEGEFGTAKSNERRRTKRTEIYLPRLNGRIASGWIDSEEKFFKRYQLLRNLWHVNPDREDRLFLVFPAANHRLVDEANGFRRQLDDDWKRRVAVVQLESLHERLMERAKGDAALEACLAEFAEKYLPGRPHEIGG